MLGADSMTLWGSRFGNLDAQGVGIDIESCLRARFSGPPRSASDERSSIVATGTRCEQADASPNGTSQVEKFRCGYISMRSSLTDTEGGPSNSSAKRAIVD